MLLADRMPCAESAKEEAPGLAEHVMGRSGVPTITGNKVLDMPMHRAVGHFLQHNAGIVGG